MKKAKVLFLALLLGLSASATDFPVVYTYDTSKEQKPFELNVPVPDGNYLVTLQVGSRKRAGRTFVKSESRRLAVNDLATAKGEFKTVQFVVNKRDKTIREAETGKKPVFSLVMFDCNELKEINDKYGHEFGDIYLQKACRMIC